jgi:hypothetical protein
VKHFFAFCLVFLFGWAASAQAGEDRITTKDGKVYTGNILFHNDTSYYISSPSGAVTVSIADIEKIDLSPEDTVR